MENIRSKTNKIRNEHKELGFKNILEDIEKSIEEFGIKVLYSDMSTFDFPDSISGYSRINDIGVPEIVVNVRHSSGRRRFTMAHELGHILLHWGWPHPNLNKESSILYRNEYSNDANTQMENEAKTTNKKRTPRRCWVQIKDCDLYPVTLNIHLQGVLR